MPATGQIGATGSALGNIELGGPIPLVQAPRYPTFMLEANFADDPTARYRDVAMGAFPVAYWRLGETSGTVAADESGYGRTGIYTGGVTLNQTAFLGDADPAASFDGTNDYVAVGSYDNQFSQRLTTAYSVTAWVNPSALRASGASVTGGIVCAEYPGTGDIPFVLSYGRYDTAGVTDNRFWGGFWVSSTGWDIVKDAAPYDDPGQWVHLALTWFQSPDTLVLYRDGQEVVRRTPTNNVSPATAGSGAVIGRTWTTTGMTTPYFPGLIDDVSIYDYELSPVQVAKMYAAGPVRSVAQKEDAFVDLTDRVRNFATRHGRSTSNGRVEAGSLTVTLDNRDGALSPDPLVNQILNPSGEQYTYDTSLANPTYVPDNWTATGSTALASLPDATTSYGRRIIKLTSAAVAVTYATPGGDSGAMRNGMVAGRTYTFSAYVKVPTAGSAAAADVRLDFITVSGAGTVTTSSGNPAGLDAWHRLTVTRAIPADATQAYLRVRLDPHSSAGVYIYIDGVQLEEAAAATAYCDGDETDCRWGDEPHQSASHRKRTDGYLNVMPGRAMRLHATYAATAYGIVEGTIDSLRYLYPGVGFDSCVEVTVSDDFKMLSQQNFASFRRPFETPGERVRAALRAAGVSEEKISVDDDFIVNAKLVAIAGAAEEGVADTASPLDHIRNVEQSERGLFLIDKDGNHVYQGVGYRPSVQPSARFADTASTDFIYSDLPITVDDAYIVNDRRITAGSPTSSTVRQTLPASIRRHNVRSVETSQLWVSELSVWSPEASSSMPRVDSIPFKPARDPALMWPMLLGCEVSDKVDIERHPLDGDDVLTGYVHTIEGISHSWRPNDWNVNLSVAPALLGDPYVQRPSEWNTPITRPTLKASGTFTLASGVGTVGSVSFTEGCLYVFMLQHGTAAGITPSTPGVGTWTDATTSADMSIFWMIATATQTVTMTWNDSRGGSFTLQTLTLVEIVEGFQSSPIGAVNRQTYGSSSSGTFDVGTLDNPRSLVLVHVYKPGTAGQATGWEDWLELWDRAGASIVYAAARGVPGDDSVLITFNVGEGWTAQGVEIKATEQLPIG